MLRQRRTRRVPALLRVVVAGACGVSIVTATPVAGQRVSQTFRTGVHVVRVDVFPTREGRAVTGLTADDFSISEDDVPQRIESSVFVEPRADPTTARREPSSAAGALAAAASARGRLFVVFLDTHHVSPGSSARIREPLIGLLRRVLGPEDVVGVATPESSSADLTFTRNLDDLESMLERHWPWGRRQQTTDVEAAEAGYSWCYPDQAPEERCSGGGQSHTQPPDFYSGVAREMVERRRERQTLDALEDVTGWIGGIRDERKAVIVVSEGWRLFRPDETLARRSPCEAPDDAAIGVGRPRQRGGSVTAGARPADRRACERDRTVLAALDNARQFRDVADRANRVNVSFYPVDPRGLAVFDTSMAETRTSPDGVTQPLLTPSASSTRVGERLEALRGLAASTDGIAVVGANDVAGGLGRIGEDMGSYYLLSYASTNTRLDGTFRRIRVTVKRDGVLVRARRGYLAPTVAEMSPAATGPTTNRGGGSETVSPGALSEAFAALESSVPDTPLRVGVSWIAPSASAPGFATIVTELEPALTRAGAVYAAGGHVDVVVEDEGGSRLGQSGLALEAGRRHTAATLALPGVSSAALVVRVRVTASTAGAALGDTVRVRLDGSGGEVGTPLRFRKGPSAVGPWLPTSDPSFSRVESLRVDVPLRSTDGPANGALLDRNGRPLAVPVTCTIVPSSADEPGWARCELRLAPLAPAGYVVRVTVPAQAGPRDVLAPFRVR